MGKIPPSLRLIKPPMPALLGNPHGLLPSHSGTPTPSSEPAKPRYFPRKSVPKKKSQLSPKTAGGHDLGTQFTSISPNLSEAKKLFSSLIASASTTSVDLKFHNSLLQSFAQVSTVEDSISLLRHMKKTDPSFTPDRSAYHTVLAQSCRGSDNSVSRVRQVLNAMVTDGFPPDRATTDVTVRSLCQAGQEEYAIEFIKELSAKHSPPDTFTYNFIVRHLCKTRVLSTVYNFIDDMRNLFDVKSDLITYTILIDNVCNNKNLREATRLLGVLNEAGFKPDPFVYNTIMKGYCILNKGSEAMGLYNKMIEEGVEPDIVTYNTLIFGLSKSGRIKQAKQLLDVMEEKGNSPDAVTYTSLMNGMCRQGDTFGALALLEEMEAGGCRPNSCTYNTLLHGLCKARLLERANELYGVMRSADLKLESASYAIFLRALCREGRIADAYEVFDYAIKSKSLKEFAAYSTLESTLKSLKKITEQAHAPRAV